MKTFYLLDIFFQYIYLHAYILFVHIVLHLHFQFFALYVNTSHKLLINSMVNTLYIFAVIVMLLIYIYLLFLFSCLLSLTVLTFFPLSLYIFLILLLLFYVFLYYCIAVNCLCPQKEFQCILSLGSLHMTNKLRIQNEPPLKITFN